MFKSKLLLKVFIIMMTLFALITCVNADYTTDNDESTEVDYIIIHADEFKAATGAYGKVAYDEFGHKVARYTAAETNLNGETARLHVNPYEGGGDFAKTGENSMFDFPYYVLYYRTSASAAETGNLMLSNGTTFKWDGGAHIKRSTTYTGIIIDRDSYTTGNPAATTPYTNAETDQEFTLKTFPNASAAGYLDVEAFAAFRTKAQAEDFVANYTPATYTYKSDGNDDTDVDYIIMYADDIKLATGEKGEVKYDENKYKVVSYTPEESHSADESHRLYIKPADSNAGFAESGTNSFFDFSYYVVYYRASDTANSTFDVNFYNGEIFKWLGEHTITKSETYKAGLIKKETFTSGNTTSHTLPPESSWTNQQMSFKALPSGDVTGSLDIEAIAAFRTAEQANVFMGSYEPTAHRDYLDNLVIDAAELEGASESKKFTKAIEYDSTNKKAYVKFTATSNETHSDGASFDLTLSELTSDITIKDYPIIKVGYKAKVTDSYTTIDLNVGMKYLGITTRAWGPTPSFTRNETSQTLIIDMHSSSFNGGADMESYSFSNIDDDSPYNYLRLKPFYGGSMAVGDYFAVEYVGFFKTLEDANAYTHTFDRSLESIIPTYSTYKLKTNKSFTNTVTYLPFYADVDGITATSSNTSVATLGENGVITAVGVGKATITYEDSTTGISATTTVIVEAADSPIDWYAKDSDDGSTITVNVIGDSISFGVGTTDKTNTYHGRWAKAFKMNVNNWSLGGSAITGNLLLSKGQLETYVPRMERMIAGDVGTNDNVTSENTPDMIVIYGGTNDYNGNWTIGKVGDTTRNTYCGAISELIMLAWENYPNAKLVFFTPIKRCDYSTQTGYDNTGMRAYELDAYVDAMKEVCAYYDVPCIDLYNNEQVNLIGLRTTYIKDGVHMTEEGHRIFAKVTIEEMENAGVIKTHGYTAEPASTYTIAADRDLTADSHVFTASSLNTLATYESGTLLDRSRMSKHELTDDGYIKFSAETLTSKLAPTITIDFSQLDFAVTDYSYMSVIYKTNSTSSRIGTALRGADNNVYVPAIAPALVSGKKAALTVNINSYETDDIVLTGGTIPSDLYFTLSFFDSTKNMTSDSYAMIESIAFFKTKADAEAYNALNAPTDIVLGDIDGNGTVSAYDSILLSRYLVGWNGYSEAIVEENADVDKSGKVDALDGTILSRYLGKWNGYGALPYND